MVFQFVASIEWLAYLLNMLLFRCWFNIGGCKRNTGVFSGGIYFLHLIFQISDLVIQVIAALCHKVARWKSINTAKKSLIKIKWKDCRISYYNSLFILSFGFMRKSVARHRKNSFFQPLWNTLRIRLLIRFTHSLLLAAFFSIALSTHIQLLNSLTTAQFTLSTHSLSSTYSLSSFVQFFCAICSFHFVHSLGHNSFTWLEEKTSA